MNAYDLIIVGGGPAGCTAAVYAARANLKVAVIALDIGQLGTTTSVENWPGDPEGLTGPGLMERMQAHLRLYQVPWIFDQVHRIQKTDQGFELISGQEKYQARSIIVATGASAKTLGLASEQAFWGRGVSACATCDGFFYRGQTVAVIGGGNTALEEALYLSHIAKKVHLIHRRDSFRGEKILQDRLYKKVEEGSILIHYHRMLEEIMGDDSGAQQIKIRSTVDDQSETIDAQGIFIAIGHTPNTQWLGSMVETDQGYIKIGFQGIATATSTPGIFACGDVADPIYRQAITSAGSGCMAALDAERFLSHS